MEELREFITLQKIDDKEYLFEQFPNVNRVKLGRAFNQVRKLKDAKPQEALKEKKMGKLQRCQTKILKTMEEKKIVSFSMLLSFVQVDEGIELVDAEIEAITNSINKLPNYEVLNDTIKKVKPKKEALELSSLRKEIKEVNENILDFKRTVQTIYKPFNQHLKEIKQILIESNRDILSRIAANSNKFEDLKRLIKQEHDLIQERIQEVSTIIYQQMNHNITVKRSKKQ